MAKLKFKPPKEHYPEFWKYPNLNFKIDTLMFARLSALALKTLKVIIDSHIQLEAFIGDYYREVLLLCIETGEPVSLSGYGDVSILEVISEGKDIDWDMKYNACDWRLNLRLPGKNTITTLSEEMYGMVIKKIDSGFSYSENTVTPEMRLDEILKILG